jgi:hypothetical protein
LEDLIAKLSRCHYFCFANLSKLKDVRALVPRDEIVRLDRFSQIEQEAVAGIVG